MDAIIGERVQRVMNRKTNGRSERRRERRNERMREYEMERMEESLVMDIVTWNVQRMTMTEHNRRRLRSVCDIIQKEGWDLVLLSELKADESGMVWMGELTELKADESGMVWMGELTELKTDESGMVWVGGN